MNIFIIGPVRNVSADYSAEMQKYVKELRAAGHTIHFPIDDTNQKAAGFDISLENARAIAASDEVHIFYDKTSIESHFNMGVAFALRKNVVIAANEAYGPKNSYPRMLIEWQTAQEMLPLIKI